VRDCLENAGASTSHNPMGLHCLLQGQPFLFISIDTQNILRSMPTFLVKSVLLDALVLLMLCVGTLICLEPKVFLLIIFHNLYFLIIDYYVARMGEKRNACRILVGNLEGKRPLGRPRRRWVDNIKMELR
jgi:hypothetical protein